MNDVTKILGAIEDGDPKASAELLPLVYEELRKLAAHKMSNEAPGQTLQPTALVHEAWLRLTGGRNVQWQGRAHFFGAAAEAMRRILINRVRKKKAMRHGGGQQKVDITEQNLASPTKDETLLAVDEALEKFAAEDPEKAELVKLRYFVGMSVEETAEVLGISVPTANRWWSYARAWLNHEIGSNTLNQTSPKERHPAAAERQIPELRLEESKSRGQLGQS
jgi:RNA polymerase sigma factor (TIGR02999 family)